MFMSTAVVTALVTIAICGIFVLFLFKGSHWDRKRLLVCSFGSLLLSALVLTGAFGMVKIYQPDFVLDLRLSFVVLAYWFALFVGLLMWRQFSWPAAWFLPYAAFFALAPAGALAWPLVHNEETRYGEENSRSNNPMRIAGLKKQYPFESLEGRLPARPVISKGGAHLSESSKTQLEEFEKNVGSYAISREGLLRALHEGNVDAFTRREGAGFGRMRQPTPEQILENYSRGAQPIPQPGGDLSESWSEMDLKREPDSLDQGQVLSLHLRFTLQFANPAGFGYFKERRQVAGFQAHQFRWLVEEKPWKVMRLDLMGILMAEKPRVYVSAELPRMDKLREVPTRELDAFESAGLAKLHSGEILFVRDVPEGIRMVGAIRSATQCLKCHGGERGDLLGAFSYSLTRMP